MKNFRFWSVFVCMILLINTSIYAKIDPNTISAAWLFEGNAKDITGNGFDGEIEGGAKFVKGRIGKAIELDGKDDFVKIPKKMGPFEEITFAHWVNSTNRDGQWRVFFNNDGWKGGDIHYQLHPNKKIEFSINGNPGGNDTFANFMITGKEMNKWVHVATAYSAKEKKIRFFINGELDIENDWGGNPGVLDVAGIGGWFSGAVQRQWQGLLDEFLIFNTILEPNDIKKLMADGLDKILSVQPESKLTTTWATVKKVW